MIGTIFVACEVQRDGGRQRLLAFSSISFFLNAPTLVEQAEDIRYMGELGLVCDVWSVGVLLFG